MTAEAGSQPPRDREVRITRTIGGPPDVVFNAFVDGDQVAKWWAPEGFDVPADSVEIDARVGGRIHFTMVDSQTGAEYPVRFEIVELSEPELLVFSSPAMPEVGILEPTRTRVLLEPDGDGTLVTVTQGPHTEELAPSAEAGWQGSLAKLEALVGS
jgi:uncharacterized protein YndB with AHSA1/START domain